MLIPHRLPQLDLHRLVIPCSFYSDFHSTDASADQTLTNGRMYPSPSPSPSQPPLPTPADFRFFTLRFLVIACLKARALKSRITPLTWVLLARNVPFKRASSAPPSISSGSVGTIKGGEGVEIPAEGADRKTGTADAAAVPSSLRHEVCHRLLTERFLSDTSYADTEASPEGLGRALEALRVLLDDEDELLEVRVRII